MLRPLIILGAGGLAREVAMVVRRINVLEPRWEFRGFIAAAAAAAAQRDVIHGIRIAVPASAQLEVLNESYDYGCRGMCLLFVKRVQGGGGAFMDAAQWSTTCEAT